LSSSANLPAPVRRCQAPHSWSKPHQSTYVPLADLRPRRRCRGALVLTAAAQWRAEETTMSRAHHRHRSAESCGNRLISPWLEEQRRTLLRTAFRPRREAGDLSAGQSSKPQANAGAGPLPQTPRTPGPRNSMADRSSTFIAHFGLEHAADATPTSPNDPWLAPATSTTFVITTPLLQGHADRCLFSCTSHLWTIVGIGFCPMALTCFMEGLYIPLPQAAGGLQVNER